VRQLLSTFESDGEEKVKGDEFAAGTGDFKVTFQGRGKNAQEKKQQGGVGQITNQNREFHLQELF
jgi:hypothetical protein